MMVGLLSLFDTCCVLGGKNSSEKYVSSCGKAAILSLIFSMAKNNMCCTIRKATSYGTDIFLGNL